MQPEEIEGMTPELAERLRAEMEEIRRRQRERVREIVRWARWALHPDPKVRKEHGHE